MFPVQEWPRVAEYLTSIAVALWFQNHWFRRSYHRKYGIFYVKPLTRVESIIRWSIVTACLVPLATGAISGPEAVFTGIVFFAFFGWPPLAHHLARLIGLSGPDPVASDGVDNAEKDQSDGPSLG